MSHRSNLILMFIGATSFCGGVVAQAFMPQLISLATNEQLLSSMAAISLNIVANWLYDLPKRRKAGTAKRGIHRRTNRAGTSSPGAPVRHLKTK